MLSLREAAHLLNPQNEFQSSCCNCKTGCTSKRCICRKKGAICSSKCHGGCKCNNCSESADDSGTDQPQRKRVKRGHGESKASLSDSEGKVMTVSSEDESDVDDGKWLPQLFLRAEDKQLIETGDWLSDRHIAAAQMLLKKEIPKVDGFPKVDGLQLPTLAEAGRCNIMVGEGIQILNDSNKHWICVSTIGCPPNTINIYDSLCGKVSPHIIKQIAALLHCRAPYFTIRVTSSQLQEGSSDCALFAIASATSLCNGESPNSIRWDQKLMRANLLKSFEQGKMKPFPGWELHDRRIEEEEVVKEQKIKVYCSCRMPQDRKKMAQCVKCNDWFHQTCENIAASVFRKKEPFTCSSCAST